MSTEPPTVVGLTGRAGSDKDAAAAVLVSRHGFTSYAFSTPLQDVLLAMDPYVGERTRLRAVIDDLGWKRALDDPRHGPALRRYMVTLGQAMRAQFGDDVLVKHLRRRLADEYGPDLAGARVVVRDVRLPDEARLVNDLGGRVVAVVSPGVPRRPHDLRTELPDELVHGTVSAEAGQDRLDRQLLTLLDLTDLDTAMENAR